QPFLAVELEHLELLQREVVSGAGRRCNARIKHRQGHMIHVGDYPHYIFAREIIAAVAQYILKRLRDLVAIGDDPILGIALREPLLGLFKIILHGGMTTNSPNVGRLAIVGGYEADRGFQARWLQDAFDRGSGNGNVSLRPPVDIVALAVGLAPLSSSDSSKK